MNAFLVELESEIAQAYERQRRIITEIAVMQARSEVVGEYRSKLMDLRDKLKSQLTEKDEQRNSSSPVSCKAETISQMEETKNCLP